MLDLDLLAPERPRRIKRAEYDELVRLGAFEDERVELLDGVIVEMPPGYPEHACPIQQLNLVLVPKLLGKAIVRVQLDFLAAGESEPVPDLAIVPLGDYRRVHPDRAYCLIEVAYSSVRKDRLIKAPLYARSQVAEYWVVNVNEQSIDVFRNSDGLRYLSESRHGLGSTLTLLAFPEVELSVADVFA